MDFGVIIDLETTGLNPKDDEIIEVGLLQFCVGSDGKTPYITNIYGGLSEPSRSLAPEIAALTGLNDEVLKGHVIDWHLVKTWLEKASVVIAHNAAFDRAFIVQRPELSDVQTHWACSQRHIDWASKGFGSQKLTYLAADHGFVNPFAHRAVFDCSTTFRIIAPHLEELVARSYEQMVRVYAVSSPYETKDILRARQYRWNPDKRCWFKDVLESEVHAEREFLSEQVYAGPGRHVEEAISIWGDIGS